MDHSISVTLAANLDKYKQSMATASQMSSDTLAAISRAFDKLQSSATSSMSATSASLKKTGDDMDDTGQKSDSLATKIGEGLVAAVAAAAIAIGALTAKGLAAQGALANLAISNDIAASKIGKFEQVAAQNNESLAQFTTNLVALQKAMKDAATSGDKSIFDTLGVKITDSNGALRDTTQVAQEAAGKVANLSSEAAKYDAAAKLGFGGKVQLLEDIAHATDLTSATTDAQAEAVVRLGKIWHDILPGGTSMWQDISKFLSNNLTPAVTQASVSILESKNKIVAAFEQIYGGGSKFQALGDKIKNWGLDVSNWFSGVVKSATDASLAIAKYLAAKAGLGTINTNPTVTAQVPAQTPLTTGTPVTVETDAQKKLREEYDALNTSIKEKLALQQQETANNAPLTEGQRLLVKVTNDLATSGDNFNATQKATLVTQLNTLVAQEKINAAKADQRAKDQKAFDEDQKWYKTAHENELVTLSGLAQEIAAGSQLTEDQKARVKVLTDLAAHSKNLTDTQKQDITQTQDAIRLLQQQNAQLKAEQDLKDKRIASAREEVAAAEKQSESLADQVKYYGLTEEAVLKLKAAELARQLQNENLDAIERGRLEGLLDETQKQVNLQTQLSQMKADTSFWTDLESTAHTVFTSITDTSKDAWTRLRDSAKTIFFDWLYQQTLKKWIINIGTSISGSAGVSGIANAATSSAAGSALGTAGSLGSLASGLGALGGSVAAGAGWLTGATTFGGALTAGTSLIGTGSIAGGIAGAGVLAGAIAPIVVGLLGASALWSKAFGMGAKEVTGTSLQGTLTPTGATASTVSTWHQDGGWFRSDKNGTDTTALDATQTAAFASTYKAILDVSKVLGDTIGVDTTALSARVQKLNIDLTGLSDATAQQAAISKFFSDVADTISTELVPNLATFQASGETLSTTLQRVVTDYAIVKDSLASVGKSIGAVGVAGVTATEGLIAAAGNLDTLTSGLSYFQQNFLTDAERLAPVQKQVSDALAAMGESGLQTVDQFKAATLSIDVTTEAGQKLFTQMLALAPAFKQVADAAAAAAQEQADAAAATAKAQADAAAAVAQAQADAAAALAKTNQGYQDQIDALVAAQQGAAAVRDLETKGMDASTIALYDRLAALKAEDAATTAAAQAAQAAATAQAQAAATLASTNQGYQDQIDSLLAARAGDAAVRELEIKGLDASTVALYDRLAALKAEDAATKAAAQAATQDAATRASALGSAASAAFDTLQRSIQAQKDANETAFNALMDSIGASIDTVTTKITGLQQVADSLKEQVATGAGNGASYDAARQALAAAAQVARAGGALPSSDSLNGLLATVRADNSAQFGSLLDYQRAAAAANNDIADLAGAADTQLSVAQRTLTALQDQKAAATAANAIETARLDSIVTNAQAQLNSLNGIYTGVLAIPDALANLAAAIKAAMANPTAAAGATTQSLYTEYLHRPATDAEVAYWKQQAANGVDVEAAIKSSEEAKIQALYEQYLGRAGEAAGIAYYESALAKGETWAQLAAELANSPEAQGRAGAGKTNTLSASVDALTSQMGVMQSAMVRTADSTQKLAQQFDSASAGGTALLTDSV